MTTYALRLQNGTDTAVRMRMADAIMMHSPGLGKVGGRLGVRNDKDAGFVQAVAGTMNVAVSPFTSYVDGGTSDAQGGYVVINDASTNLAIAPGDATQARVDVIAVVINDTAFDGSGQTNCTLTVVQGTPGAGTPALPVTCMPLRAVNVPAGLSAGTGGLSSGNLSTDYRIYLPAGVTRVASASERDGLAVGRGAVVYRADTDVLEVSNGSTWRVYQPYRDSYKGRLSRSAGQNFTTGDQAIIDFSTVDYNTGMGVSAVTNMITANTDGVYRITAGGVYQTNNTGRRLLILKKNGTEFLRSNYANVTNASGVFITWEGPLVAGDQITVDSFQDSGSTLALSNSYVAVSEVR